MKYLIGLVLAVSLSLRVAVPAFADAGVAVELNTTVIGGDSGGGNNYRGWDTNVYVYNGTNWGESQFGSYINNKPQEQAKPSSPLYAQKDIQSTPQGVVVIQQPQPPKIVTPAAPEAPKEENKDMMIYAFIGLGVILIGLILYMVIPKERSYD